MEWKVEVGSSSLGKTLRRSFREQSKTPRQGAVLQRLGWGIRPRHDHPPAFWFIQRLYAKAFRPSLLNMNVHPCWISALSDLSQSTSSLPFKNWTIATEKLEWPLKAPRQALQSFRAWNADQFCTSKIFKILFTSSPSFANISLQRSAGALTCRSARRQSTKLNCSPSYPFGKMQQWLASLRRN